MEYAVRCNIRDHHAHTYMAVPWYRVTRYVLMRAIRLIVWYCPTDESEVVACCTQYTTVFCAANIWFCENLSNAPSTNNLC